MDWDFGGPTALRDSVLKSLGLVTPSGVESDPEFRAEIDRATRIGLRAAAVVLVGPWRWVRSSWASVQFSGC
jgi:hypothetical protein